MGEPANGTSHLWNHKDKKHWVEGDCFTLFARELSITWGSDERYWRWPLLLTDSCGERQEAAELINVCWLDIHAQFEMAYLTPDTVYEAVFIVKLQDPAYGWNVPVNLRLTLPDGTKQEHKVDLLEKPRDSWIEISAGEFKTSCYGKCGECCCCREVKVGLFEREVLNWKKGLIVKGVAFRPKIA